MRYPAELYSASPRTYDGLPELQYPCHDCDILVTACGRICMQRKKINISTVLAGQKLGIKEVDDGIWLVSFMHYDLGYIDLEQRTLQTIDNPFGTRLSPMSLVRSVTHVSGSDKRQLGGGSGIRTHDTVSRIHAFQACAFSHSATPPAQEMRPIYHRPSPDNPAKNSRIAPRAPARCEHFGKNQAAARIEPPGTFCRPYG